MKADDKVARESRSESALGGTSRVSSEGKTWNATEENGSGSPAVPYRAWLAPHANHAQITPNAMKRMPMERM